MSYNSYTDVYTIDKRSWSEELHSVSALVRIIKTQKPTQKKQTKSHAAYLM